jgi:hypothetical protein
VLLLGNRHRASGFRSRTIFAPQRIIERRVAATVPAATDAASGEGIEWNFRSAPLNSRCPR